MTEFEITNIIHSTEPAVITAAPYKKAARPERTGSRRSTVAGELFKAPYDAPDLEGATIDRSSSKDDVFTDDRMVKHHSLHGEVRKRTGVI